jgi:para-nitrobenzyl esterase
MNQPAKPIVQTRSGKLAGNYEEGLCIFRGIPYASPPVGRLRWLPPEPHPPWTGVRPAHTFGAASLQSPDMLTGIPELQCRDPQSEDCLFLNIWSPGLQGPLRPVMVWIHGGAFTMGSGSQPLYRGNFLAKRGNVVVVTLNYRLGMLGFLNLNEITAKRIPATGNEGLLDQIAALEWVRDNIAGFGGDPHNVTVFGESAGSMSVSCLMTIPQARGLFHKAIMQSGAPNVVRPLAAAVKVAQEYLNVLKLKPTEVEALRSLPAARLVSAQAVTALKIGGITPVGPLIDGRIISASPLDKIQAGSSAGVPLLCGATQEESKLFSLLELHARDLDESRLKRRVARIVPPEKAEALIETYRQARARRGLSTSPFDLFSAIQTDSMFRVPVIRVAEAQMRNQTAAFNYLFTWQSPFAGGSLGACHTLEIGFVFGTHWPEFCGTGPLAEVLSRNMQEAWIAFARSGDPSCESLGRWPPYGAQRETMILGEHCRVEEAPFEEERAFWDALDEVSPDRAVI